MPNVNFKFGSHIVEDQVDFNSLPASSIEFLLTYGLKQYLADGAAVPKDAAESEDERDALKREGVRRRILKIKEGTCAIRETKAKEPADPAAKHKAAVLMEMASAIAKAKGKPLPTRTGKKAEPERLDAILAAIYAKRQAEVDKLVAKRVADDAKLSTQLGDMTEVDDLI